MSRVRRAVAIVAALTAVMPSIASAYDTGPHFDMTRDAMSAEGFGSGAVQLAQVNNWFIDLYENYEKIPNSGHSGAMLRFLGGAFFTENWNLAVARAADRSHFDDTNGGFPSTGAITAEWDRLQRATGTLAREARDANDPKKLVRVLGISLHQVQDFYTHTNWLEPGSAAGASGPAWEPRGYGRTPTWFDIPATVRNGADLYSAGSLGRARDHGSWKADNNQTLTHSMSKDWPGRPLYTDAYVASYFASRQWIQGIRATVGDDAFWRRAQAAAGASSIAKDIGGATNISVAGGHWQGQGEACNPSISSLSCGARSGPGGDLLDLREATASYFTGGRTADRAAWEVLVLRIADPAPTGPLLTFPSSQTMQRNVRFVELAITRFAQIDDMDVGSGADFFMRAGIGGQPYLSGVINGRDTFTFGRPNAPFRFLKAITPATVAQVPVASLKVRIRTANVSGGGTDDSVYLRISNSQRFALDKRLYDDFERGDNDTYSVPIDSAVLTGLSVGDIKYLQLEKAGRDAWRPSEIEITLNGKVVVPATAIRRWLGPSAPAWRSAYVATAPTTRHVPVQLRLFEMDASMLGGNTFVDLHPWDGRRVVVRTYLPGTPTITGRETGASTYGGRLGDRSLGSLDWRLRTVVPVPGPLIAPPDPKPDLAIAALSYGSITVGNSGAQAAGPFMVSTNDGLTTSVGGLAAGGQVTLTWEPTVCEGRHEAVVDSTNLVTESNELNNTGGFDWLC